MTLSRTTSILAAMTIATTIALSGCSLLSPGQNTAGACLQLKDALDEVTTDITDASATLVSDPSGASEAITTTAGTFAQAADAIGNSEVHDAAVEASQTFTAFSDVIADYADDPASTDLDALTASATAVQEQMVALGDICAP